MFNLLEAVEREEGALALAGVVAHPQPHRQLIGRRRAQLEGVVLVRRARARRVEEFEVKVGVGVLVAGGALLAHRTAAQRVTWREWVGGFTTACDNVADIS